MQFTDEQVVRVQGGPGGDGSAHLHREKYEPLGGPDGGDGGDGGPVKLVCTSDHEHLGHLQRGRVYQGGPGQDGGSNKKSGAKGDPQVLRVPPGTRAYEMPQNFLLCELLNEDDEFTLVEGGRGGLGNAALAAGSRRAKQEAEPGEPGPKMLVRLVYRVPADIAVFDGFHLGQPLFSALFGKIEKHWIFQQAPRSRFVELAYQRFQCLVSPLPERDLQSDAPGSVLLHPEHLYYPHTWLVSLLHRPAEQAELLIEQLFADASEVELRGLERVVLVGEKSEPVEVPAEPPEGARLEKVTVGDPADDEVIRDALGESLVTGSKA